MRLFIGINFEEHIKNTIQEVIKEIKSYSLQGKFVSNEHMHLTLEFIGDVNEDHKVESIKNAIDQISTKAFSLQLSNLGFFKRREGNIYWLGIEESSELLDVQSQIHDILSKTGFQLESREYKPHLTIGRKVLIDESFNSNRVLDTIKQLKVDVSKIDLIKSHQIKGKLTHEIIYSKTL